MLIRAIKVLLSMRTSFWFVRCIFLTVMSLLLSNAFFVESAAIDKSLTFTETALISSKWFMLSALRLNVAIFCWVTSISRRLVVSRF